MQIYRGSHNLRIEMSQTIFLNNHGEAPYRKTNRKRLIITSELPAAKILEMLSEKVYKTRRALFQRSESFAKTSIKISSISPDTNEIQLTRTLAKGPVIIYRPGEGGGFGAKQGEI